MAWQAEFRLTDISLAGGSGWAPLVWNVHTRSRQNHSAWGLCMAAAGIQILALDMNGHSFDG